MAYSSRTVPVVRPPINFNVPELVTVSTNPWEIDQALTTVTSTKAAQLDRARQLRFLIHMIGDIHQPLHAAELYSDEFPSGDLGGNRCGALKLHRVWHRFPSIVLPFRPAYRYTIAGVTQKNLHSYWDSGANTWATGLKRPLDVQGEAWLSNLTGYITQVRPPLKFSRPPP